MAVSQSDIDALNEAIASGERQVSLNGQQVTYRSIDQLILAKQHLERELVRESATTASTRVRKQIYWSYGGRGYDS